MSSSTFENAVLTPRTRGKGSGSPFKLFNVISVLFLCLLLQVGAAVAQPNTDTPPFCFGCVSEDIKFVGITVDPPIDAKCTDALIVPGVKVTIKLDVTSKTRYGFYIMYTLQQKLADGTIVPVANATNLRECHPVELAKGLFSLTLQFKPDLIAGATLQIVNVLTAWGNQESELGFCGTATTINEAGVTCSKLDPKCKFYPEVSFEAKITTKPNAAVLAASPICAGSAAALTISGTPGAIVAYKIGTAVQSPATLNSDGDFIVNIPSNVAVPPSVTVTITKVTNPDDPTCFDATEKTGTLTINAPATVDAGPNQLVCSNQTITLAGSYTNAPGVTWTGGSGTFSNSRSVSSTYAPSAGELGTAVTLRLTTDDPAGPCPAVSDLVTITINRATSVNGGLDKEVCAGGTTTTMTATDLGGASSVTWSASSGSFSAPNALSTTYTPSITTGSITITVTTNDPEGPCGPSVDYVVVKVFPATSVNGGADKSVCSGGTTETMTATNLGGASSVIWSASSGSFSAPNALSTTYTPSITSGSITITVTTNDPEGPCGASVDYVVVTVFPATSVNGGADKEVCSGGTVTLTVDGSIGGASGVTWSALSGSFGTPNALSTTYTPSITTGSITITVTTNDPEGPCGTSVDYVVVKVFPATSVNGGADKEVCSGGTTSTMTATDLGGASTVLWTAPSGTFSAPNALSTTYTPSITSGTITITVTTNDPTGPCGPSVDYVVVTVFPAASVNGGQDAGTCAGGSVNLAVVGSIGGASGVTWSAPSGSFGTPNALSTTYTPSIASGSVTVTVTTNDPAGPCGIAVDYVVVTVSGVATANAGQNQTICSGSVVNLNGSVGGAATSGSWSFVGSGTPGIFGNASNPVTTYTPSPQDIIARTVTLRLTTNDPQGPCEAVSSLVTITINPAANVNAGSDAAVCAGGTVNLAVVGALGGASSVTWSAPSGSFGTPNATSTTYTPPTTSGTYTVTVTTNDPDLTGPCSAAVDYVLVRVDGKATVGAMAPIIICQGQQAQLAGVIGGTASSLTWSGGNGGYTPNNTTGNAKYLPNGPEQVAQSVVLTLTTNDPAGECPAAVGTVTITINRAATVSITTPPATTCAGVSVSLTATTNSAPVTWSVPNSAGTFSPNPGLTTQFTPTTTGVLTITATAADPDGAGPCGTATSTVVVTVNICDPGYCTYTQGYFGQDVGNGKASYKNGSACVQSRTQQTIEFALAKWGVNGMQVSNMNFKNVPDDVAKIREYLPGGGPSAPYLGAKSGLSAKNPKNTLLAQTITLGLNMGLNSTLGAFTLKNEWLRTGSSSDCGANTNGISTQCFKFDISANMNVDGTPGVQINDIWILANRALKGESVPVGLSAIAGAADAVNNAFDECRVPLGWSSTNPCITTAPVIGGVANMGAADRSTGSLKVNAYPNPFKDRVFIKFTSPVSGKAVVEIYDMTGRRLEVMNKGTVVAGRENLVEYNVPVANRNSIIYRVTVDKFSVNGRLISPTK